MFSFCFASRFERHTACTWSCGRNSVQVTQGAVVDALANRNFIVNDGSGGMHAQGLGTVANTTVIGDDGLAPDPKSLQCLSLKNQAFAMEVEIVHEGLHGDALGIDKTLIGVGNKAVRREKGPHQGPYNLGAYKLLYPDNRNDFP